MGRFFFLHRRRCICTVSQLICQCHQAVIDLPLDLRFTLLAFLIFLHRNILVDHINRKTAPFVEYLLQYPL